MHEKLRMKKSCNTDENERRNELQSESDYGRLMDKQLQFNSTNNRDPLR